MLGSRAEGIAEQSKSQSQKAVSDDAKLLKTQRRAIDLHKTVTEAFAAMLVDAQVDLSICKLQLEEAIHHEFAPTEPPTPDIETLSHKLLNACIKQPERGLSQWLAQRADSGSPRIIYPDRARVEARLEHLRGTPQKKLIRSRMSSLLKKADLWIPDARLEQLLWGPSRSMNLAQIEYLKPGTWLKHKENMIISGGIGTGKTWLACALGYQACIKGWRTSYRRMHELLEELSNARASKTLSNALQDLAKIELLIIDDWDLSQLSADQYQDLLTVIAERENRCSTLIASQQPPEKWFDAIHDNQHALRLLDRLAYARQKFHLTGESMRKRMAEAASSECVNNDQHSAPAATQQAESLVTPSPAPSGSIDTTSSAQPATSSTDAPEHIMEGHASLPEDKPDTQEAAPSTVGTEKSAQRK